MISRHGIRADKRFGQHFLASAKVVEAILRRAEGSPGILEIGPGIGVLTKPLSELAERTVAIELDERVLPVVADYAPLAEIIHADALETDWREILSSLPHPAAIVSNMPYNISGPLLTRVASVKGQISRAVLMMQKEVGERVLAPPNDSARGSLSVFLQAQFEITKVCAVPPGSFMPPPKVDSVVLEFIPKPVPDRPEFFKFVRGGFQQPRKTLWNNVASQGMTRDRFDHFIEATGHPATVRPHQLTLEDWEMLFSSFGG